MIIQAKTKKWNCQLHIDLNLYVLKKSTNMKTSFTIEGQMILKHGIRMETCEILQIALVLDFVFEFEFARN